MDPEDRHGRKATLRSELLARRGAMDPLARAQEDAADLEVLTASPVWKRSQRLVAYVALGSEASVDGLIDRGLTEGKEVFIPRVEKGRALSWHRVTGAPGRWRDGLVPGALSIPEPVGEGVALSEVCSAPTLMVVPAVGLDGAGWRLGHGGAYYDRVLQALDRLPVRPQTVSVVPSVCLTDLASVVEPWDEPVEVVLSAGEVRGGTAPDLLEKGQD